MSKDTFWPSDREVIPAASSAVAWTNTSLAPPSGEMKPKPLEELKNLTVPMVMMSPLRMIARTDVRTAKTSSREVSGPGAHEAGRDWRFFWSSRAGAMHLNRAKYKAVRTQGPGSLRQAGFAQTVAEQFQVLRPPEWNPVLEGGGAQLGIELMQMPRRAR